MRHGITVCLYFLPPHRVKEVDWFMMEGISSLVAVVPVIAKADTHTAPEMEAYRKEILQVRRVTYSHNTWCVHSVNGNRLASLFGWKGAAPLKVALRGAKWQIVGQSGNLSNVTVLPREAARELSALTTGHCFGMAAFSPP